MLVLAITGFEADPQAVTATIGINPTSTGRKGEPARSGRVRTFNGWWFEATPERLCDGADHAAALSSILEQLRGREQKFTKLREEVAPTEVTIYGGLYVPSELQCGVWLVPCDMLLLANCGIGWGLDLFVQD